MREDWQKHASGGVNLDQLDLVTLLNCVHELHTRETSALKAEISRLTASHIQLGSATATGNSVANPNWFAQASRIEEPPLEPHFSRIEDPAVNMMCSAQANRIEENPERDTDVASEQKDDWNDLIGSCPPATQSATAPQGAQSSSLASQRGSTMGSSGHTLGSSGHTRTPQDEKSDSSKSKMALLLQKTRALNALPTSKTFANASISEILAHAERGEVKPKNAIQRCIMSPQFDGMMSFIIAVNVTLIALEAEYRGMRIESDLQSSDPGSRPQWPGAEDLFRTMEWAFGIIFWVELLLRGYCERFKMFRSCLAWIDMVVAVTWAVGKVGVLGNFNPTVLRAVRVMRAMRLIKLLRVIEAFDSLQLMITAFLGSMAGMMWFSIILTLVLTFCALLTTEVLHQYYFMDPGEDNRWDIYDSDSTYGMFLCFGTFTRSLFSMYELALANWPPLGRMLSEEVSQWFMLFTVGHKLVIGFAMVGVINGIFMQETMACVALDDDTMVRQKKRQGRALKTKMNRLFKLADVDGNGTLCLEEFLAVLELREVRTWLCSMGFDSHDVETAFWMLAGEDGRITEEELVQGVGHLRGPARSIDVASLLAMGSIGKNSIRALDDVRAGPPSQHAPGASFAQQTSAALGASPARLADAAPGASASRQAPAAAGAHSGPSRSATGPAVGAAGATGQLAAQGAAPVKAAH